MTKQVIYRYLGTNGVLDTPIHIEGAFYVRMVRIHADKDMVLTDGVKKVNYITIPEGELENWKEIRLDATN